MAFPPAPPAGSADGYLQELAKRVELRQYNAPGDQAKLLGETLARDLGLIGVRTYYAPPEGSSDAGDLPRATGLQLHALQAFVDNFMTPDAGNQRLLICWDTGTGKTIAAITIAQRFATLFRSYKLISPELRPTIFIIGFTRSVIQAEMLRDPRHGFITYNEIRELKRLKDLAKDAPPGSPIVRQLHGFVGTLKRSLTDRSRGGYYRFFGYKEFASQLLTVTSKGERAGVKVLDIFLRPTLGVDGNEAAEDDRDQMAVFANRIAGYEKKGLLRVNVELLSQLRRSLIIADEIHNVYNVHDPNMYGVAIQFVLNAFPPSETPRAIFMSATPMTGSPTEVVDLLNLLVPKSYLPDNRPLMKRDFFVRNSNGLTLLPGAGDRISTLAAGRVSFLTVEMEKSAGALAGDQMFPERVFMGEDINEARASSSSGAPPKIPFLRFVSCPLAPEHKKALIGWMRGKDAGKEMTLPTASDYCLYDMVFPNPLESSGSLPLFNSSTSSVGTLYSVLARAEPGWLASHQIEVSSETSNSGRNNPVVTGEFLRLDNGLAKYSGKYSRFVQLVSEIVTSGRAGKALVYHDRVQLTGVSFLAEVLRHNGFVDLGEPPIANTMCSVCGRTLKNHAKDKQHDFQPARYAVVAGSMDKSSQERAMSLFNRPSNDDGHEVRVLLGSMVIIEGLDFKAVRFQFVLSIPRNIPTLIQILGRSHRRGSHASLPAGERWVETYILVNQDDSLPASPPDIVKLTRNMREYLIILDVLSALRRPGINGFLTQSRAVSDMKPSLEGLPFRPPLSPEEAQKLPNVDDTYYAYNAAANDLIRLKDAIRGLFNVRPIWEKQELITALTTPGVVLGLAGDMSLTPAEQADLALTYLSRPVADLKAESRITGNSLVAANIQISIGGSREFRKLSALVAGDLVYYVAFPVETVGGVSRIVADVESYIRPTLAHQVPRRINLRNYANRHLKEANFTKRLEAFLDQYDLATDFRNILVEFGPDFHYPLLEHVIDRVHRGKKLDHALDGAFKLYLKFKVLVTMCHLKRAQGFEELVSLVSGRSEVPGSQVVGYIHEEAGRIYAPTGRDADNAWHSVPLSVLGRSSYRTENSTIVGYMELQRGVPKFKIREPKQVLEKRQVRDIRSLNRGAVCETRKRSDQIALARKLTSRPKSDIERMSTPEICALVRDQLLVEEEKARGGKDGLAKGLRWFYLFNERLPALAALTSA